MVVFSINDIFVKFLNYGINDINYNKNSKVLIQIIIFLISTILIIKKLKIFVIQKIVFLILTILIIIKLKIFLIQIIIFLIILNLP
jgi:hypothetical protein